MNGAGHRPVLHRLTLGIGVVFSHTEILSNVLDGVERITELKRELGLNQLYPVPNADA